MYCRQKLLMTLDLLVTCEVKVFSIVGFSSDKKEKNNNSKMKRTGIKYYRLRVLLLYIFQLLSSYIEHNLENFSDVRT